MIPTRAEVVLVAEGGDAKTVLRPGSSLQVTAFHEPADAIAHLAALKSRAVPAVFVLGRQTVNKSAVMMELATRYRDVPVVIATFAETAEGIGGYGVTRLAGSDALMDAVASACQSAAQRARVRTTLDRFNVRLSADAMTFDPRQQQRLLLSRLYFDNILQHARDGIFVTDLQGVVALWNRAAEALFGVAASQIVGRNIATVDAGMARAVGELSAATASTAMALQVTHAGGVRDVDVSFSLIADSAGESVALSGIARDVTEQRRMHRELEAKAEALAQSNRHKDEFLAVLSHELRTPLNVVLGWAHMLEMTADDEEAVRRGLTIIRRNAQLQQRLVADLLDYARIVAGRLSLACEPTVVADAVRLVVDELRPALAEREMTVLEAYETDAKADLDRDRFRQVLANLISNAMKFTAPGGQISVCVRARPGSIDTHIADNGQGIPEEFLPHVFEEFTQADSSTTRRQSGLGMGLAIARRIVELHGGDIRVQSAGTGQGAEFVVALPRSRADV